MSKINLRKIFLIHATLMVTGVCFSSKAFAVLTLNQYLKNVVEQNKEVQSAELKSKAGELRTEEGDHLLALSFFAQADLLVDKRQTQSPSFQGTQNNKNSYSLGFSKLTNWGMQTKISYNLTKTEIVGANSSLVPTPSYFDGKPMIEISQPLWGNFFGAATRAQVDLLESSARSMQFLESFQKKSLLMAAEMAYYRLSIARQLIGIQKSNLKRAEEFEAWMKKRMELHIAERADYSQAEAAAEIRKLDVQMALDEVGNAERSFNLTRGSSDGEKIEELEKIDPQYLLSMTEPKRMEKREDLKALEEQVIIAESNAKISQNKNKPVLDIYANYSLNARSSEQNEAFSNSIKSTYPMWSAGLKFIAPLDFFTLSNIYDGYEHEKLSAEKNYQFKSFEQDYEWKDLLKKFTDSKRRLTLAVNIEEAQKKKLDLERKRLDRGRSTTYQVLMFEQDYSQSVMQRIRISEEVLQSYTKLKMYSDPAALSSSTVYQANFGGFLR